MLRFADRLESCLGALPDLLAAERLPLARLAAAHIEAAERLAATDTEAGGARLWREAAGDTAARFCHELIDAAGDFPSLPGRHYPALFEALAAGAVVRPAYGRHPRLAIWGLLEARLQQADLVVLGGLNEGTWPGPPAHDPWMSRQMRRDFEIAVPERAIGIAAHDFAQAIAAPEVALTRAARSEGVPTVPSRWLLRLDAVLRAVGLDNTPRSDPAILAAADGLDAAEYRPLPPAAPRPPLSARPRKLSVTQIETWLGDPYAIYARHILGLTALDELDADPGRADLGICVHDALAEFVRRFPRELPADPASELIAIGRRHFGAVLSRPGAWAFWWPRFERIAHWLVAEEATHRTATIESFSELKGSLTLRGLPGGSFELTAMADRIDRLGSGAFLLIDYKTGSLPTRKAIDAGFAPQLPLEGAILRDGSFGEVSGTPAALEYWKLGGRRRPGKRCLIDDGEPLALVDRAHAKLRALVDALRRSGNPLSRSPGAGAAAALFGLRASRTGWARRDRGMVGAFHPRTAPQAAHPRASVWVEASAGTGKTTVLTDRLLRLMLDGTDPARILCLTFTRAAAAEMANRLDGELANWATLPTGELVQTLQQLTGEFADEGVIARARQLFALVLDTPGGVKISTIHAFCQTLLRRFPLEAGVSPEFAVIEERGADESLGEAAQNVIIAARKGGDPELAEALSIVADYTAEERFGELMRALAQERGKLQRALRPRPRRPAAQTVGGAVVGGRDDDRARLVEEFCAENAGDEAALRLAAEALATGSPADCDRAASDRRLVRRRTGPPAGYAGGIRSPFSDRKGRDPGAADHRCCDPQSRLRCCRDPRHRGRAGPRTAPDARRVRRA